MAMAGYNRVTGAGHGRTTAHGRRWKRPNTLRAIAAPIASSRFVVSEIHYNPTEPTDAKRLRRDSTTTTTSNSLNCTIPSNARRRRWAGWPLRKALRSPSGDETLAPGARIVVAASENALSACGTARGRMWREATPPDGSITAAKRLTLSNATGEHPGPHRLRRRRRVAGAGGRRRQFADAGPRCAQTISGRAAAWRASVEYGGSPGAAGRASHSGT